MITTPCIRGLCWHCSVKWPIRQARIDAALLRIPGLFVHGNSYRGISVNLCIDEAPAVAERVVHHLGGTVE